MISIRTLASFARSGVLITSDDAAELLGCTRSRIRQLWAAGELRSISLGRSDRFRVLDLGEVQRYAARRPKTGRPRGGARMD